MVSLEDVELRSSLREPWVSISIILSLPGETRSAAHVLAGILILRALQHGNYSFSSCNCGGFLMINSMSANREPTLASVNKIPTWQSFHEMIFHSKWKIPLMHRSMNDVPNNYSVARCFTIPIQVQKQRSQMCTTLRRLFLSAYSRRLLFIVLLGRWSACMSAISVSRRPC